MVHLLGLTGLGVERETRISVPQPNALFDTLAPLHPFERRRTSSASTASRGCLAPFNQKSPSVSHKQVQGVRQRLHAHAQSRETRKSR